MWAMFCLWYWSSLSLASTQIFTREDYVMKKSSLTDMIDRTISMDTTLGVPSAMQCQALCMRSSSCRSFFYNTRSELCQRNNADCDGPDESEALLGTNCFAFTSKGFILQTQTGHFVHDGLQLNISIGGKSMDWAAAEDVCQTKSGQLMSLDTMGKFEFLIDVIKSNGDSRGKIFHIGLSDAVKEGKWVWKNGKSMDIDSPMWCKDQPDDGVILLSQDQAALCNTRVCPFKLDDIWHDQSGYPVCEFSYH